MVAMARAAEDAGFDSIWLGDHLLYDLPNGEVRGPWEVWTALAALASVTERIELGPLVASTSFHAPAMLATLAAPLPRPGGAGQAGRHGRRDLRWAADPRARCRLEPARIHRVRLSLRQAD